MSHVLLPASTHFADLAGPLVDKWNAARLTASGAVQAERNAQHALAHLSRYQAISAKTGVPVALFMGWHMRESGFNFDKNLVNGQSIHQRTTIVPIGRGPYPDFEAAAVDAVSVQYGSHKPAIHWTLARMLYEAHRFNGFGYVVSTGAHTVPPRSSPYLWSGTTEYVSGKYVADHVFRSDVVDSQLGIAALWKVLESKHHIPITPS